MSQRVELRTIVVATLRRWWLVVPLTLFAAGVAFAVSLSITPVYRASTSVLVGGGLDDTSVSADDIDVSEHLTLTYADMVGRQPVLQGVVDSLGLRTTWQQLRTRVHGELVPGNTELIVITADGPSTQEATGIASLPSLSVTLTVPLTTTLAAATGVDLNRTSTVSVACACCACTIEATENSRTNTDIATFFRCTDLDIRLV